MRVMSSETSLWRIRLAAASRFPISLHFFRYGSSILHELLGNCDKAYPLLKVEVPKSKMSLLAWTKEEKVTAVPITEKSSGLKLECRCSIVIRNSHWGEQNATTLCLLFMETSVTILEGVVAWANIVPLPRLIPLTVFVGSDAVASTLRREQMPREMNHAPQLPDLWVSNFYLWLVDQD